MEIEVTIDVEEADYFRFIEAMKPYFVDDFDQWNVFFDTKDLSLLPASYRARIRYIKPKIAREQIFICVKSGEKMSGGIAQRREIETEISKELADSIIQHPENFYRCAPQIIQEELTSFSSKDFAFLVDFHSQRRIFQFEDIHIEADECTLPNDVKFYEIEVESTTPEIAKEKLIQKFHELNIPFVLAPYSKYKRLIDVPPNQRLSSFLKSKIEQFHQ